MDPFSNRKDGINLNGSDGDKNEFHQENSVLVFRSCFPWIHILSNWFITYQNYLLLIAQILRGFVLAQTMFFPCVYMRSTYLDSIKKNTLTMLPNIADYCTDDVNSLKLL